MNKLNEKKCKNTSITRLNVYRQEKLPAWTISDLHTAQCGQPQASHLLRRGEHRGTGCDRDEPGCGRSADSSEQGSHREQEHTELQQIQYD